MTSGRRWVLASSAAACLLALPGCSDDDSVGFDFDFGRGPAGWEAGFADYPAGEDAVYKLEEDYRPLPEPLGPARSGLFIAGHNYSDDLWMQYKLPVSLPPNRSFLVRFDVQIATNALRGCGGVGGAPGEDVTVKAGVSIAEPAPEVDGGMWRLTADKGQQTSAGKDAVVIGNLASSRACDQVKLAQQVRAQEQEIARLREEQAIFESILSAESRAANPLSINRFKVVPDVQPGEYRYRLLLLLAPGSRRDRDFQGRMELVVSLNDGTKTVMMTFPETGDPSAAAFRLTFRYFHRVEGIFRVDPKAKVESVQARVYEAGSDQVRAAQSATPG